MKKYEEGEYFCLTDKEEEELLYLDRIRRARMNYYYSSNKMMRPRREVVRNSKKGSGKSNLYDIPDPTRAATGRCVASSKDTSWLVFVVDRRTSNNKSKSNNKNCSAECFIWNRYSHVKLQLPNLNDSKSFFKCVLCCSSEVTNLDGEFKVFFCSKDEFSFIWSAPNLQNWNKIVLRQYHVDYICISDCVSLPNWTRREFCVVSNYGQLSFVHSSMTKTRKDIWVPNSLNVMYERRLVVNYRGTTLYLLQRKVGSAAWEVWKMNLSSLWLENNNDDSTIWESLSDSDKGLVFFTSRSYSSEYQSRSLGRQSCVCFTEEDDDDDHNLYVFWLVDQTLSVFKNQPNSGFPYCFPHIPHYSGIIWFYFYSVLEEHSCLRTRKIVDDEAKKTTPWRSGRRSNGDICRKLPTDILISVAEYLNNATDYANFRGVCKMWREIAQPICWKPGDDHLSCKIPWLMMFDHQKKSSNWSFMEPTRNTQYYCNNNNKKKELLSGGYNKVEYSKDGWLLVTCRGTRTIFFFEPFSNVKINLPDIPEDFEERNDGMSFSSSPTSADWSILIQMCPEPDIIDFACLSSGSIDEGWMEVTSDLVNNNCNFICCSCSPLFHDGKFYTLGQDGSLLRKNFLDDALIGAFTYFTSPDDEPVASGTRYLVSCKDELYQVIIGPLGRSVRVYKLIMDDETDYYFEWGEVKSVGDFAFFVCETSSFATPVAEIAHRNSINFPLLVENCCLSYKLEESRFTSFDGDSLDRDIYKRKQLFGGCTWIQPKVVRAYR